MNIKTDFPDQMKKGSRALYIHIPFCKYRCSYCDFRTQAIDAQDPTIAQYMDSLIEQIFKLGRSGAFDKIETIYIGGGTPSYIGSKYLTSLMYAIGLSMNLTDAIEVTCECNPDSLDERLVFDLFALGVNRLSIGVQSFNDESLKALGRAHDRDSAIKAINAAKKRFENVSIDFMCGLPGQDLASFEKDLEMAIGLNVSHISVYPLTIEDATRISHQVAEGEIGLPDDDEVASMMELAHRLLEDAGFEHYEVSNYAKPGFRSRHNMAYWSGKPYLGLGDGAVGMCEDGSARIRIMNGEVIDELSSAQAKCEDIMLAMRTIDGINEGELEELDSSTLKGIAGAFQNLQEKGLVEKRGSRLVPSERGFLLGNEIYEAILEFFH